MSYSFLDTCWSLLIRYTTTNRISWVNLAHRHTLVVCPPASCGCWRRASSCLTPSWYNSAVRSNKPFFVNAVFQPPLVFPVGVSGLLLVITISDLTRPTTHPRGVSTTTSCSECRSMRSSLWRLWWERAVSWTFTPTARVRHASCAETQLRTSLAQWRSFHTSSHTHTDLHTKSNAPSLPLPPPWWQVGRKVWRSRMCTSATTGWTNLLIFFTKSTATAIQCAPSPMPSTTSPRDSHPKGTSQ